MLESDFLTNYFMRRVYFSSDDDDLALVRQSLAGRTEAFGALVTRYQRVMYTVAVRMLGNSEDAQDATQDAFIKAFQRLTTFDTSHRFYSWMYRILINECLNLNRGRHPEEPLGIEAAGGPSPFDTTVAGQLRTQIHTALLRLTPEYRTVVVLRHFAGQSVRGNRRDTGDSGENREVPVVHGAPAAWRAVARLERTTEGRSPMIRPELEALLHGALDDTLTPEQRNRLAQLMAESREVRERANELAKLAGLIDALGAPDIPSDLVENVLAQVSHRPHSVRPLTLQRGVTVNKKILFGLAAAAAIVLAVITYNSNPPATVGTEATIGAAQRAQAPQIAAKDVKLGDTSTQDVQQTEMWDQLAKDEDLRTALQDENFRAELLNVELRSWLSSESMLRALRDPLFAQKLKAQAVSRQLTDVELKKIEDSNLRLSLMNKSFLKALGNPNFRDVLTRNGVAAALARPAFQNAMRNARFEASLKDPAFTARMRMARAQ